jgi:uncharacterized membrane protein YhhN
VIGFAAAMAVAVVDWVAVGRDLRRLEAALKPIVPLPLIAVALAAHAWWFAAGLALCLLGDVFLLPQVDRFRSGLAAFLLAHLAFIGGFASLRLEPERMLYGLPALIGVLWAAPAILGHAPARLRAPVAVYALAIVTMVAASWMPHRPLLVVGAMLFFASDLWLAWNRFVQPMPRGRLVVMTTYHLAIGVLTLGLLF